MRAICGSASARAASKSSPGSTLAPRPFCAPAATPRGLTLDPAMRSGAHGDRTPALKVFRTSMRMPRRSSSVASHPSSTLASSPLALHASMLPCVTRIRAVQASIFCKISARRRTVSCDTAAPSPAPPTQHDRRIGLVEISSSCDSVVGHLSYGDAAEPRFAMRRLIEVRAPAELRGQFGSRHQPATGPHGAAASALPRCGNARPVAALALELRLTPAV